eukprot:CAMPEP_0182843620 /NCGR_PEP_ID=MMETSP0006_2-20121128/26292_1 /TAXON_ID=97485 /ORGANISM="Prymnesium parvum, Strain Texoma1" /LENGTH=290 /DNA_ID=CAMNT_0024973439 /DNA_START=290 /DNA_END=1162 /DNA_ORIENTATION=+
MNFKKRKRYCSAEGLRARAAGEVLRNECAQAESAISLAPAARKLGEKLLHDRGVLARVDRRVQPCSRGDVRVRLESDSLQCVIRRDILEDLLLRERLSALGVPVQPHASTLVVLIVRDAHVVRSRLDDVRVWRLHQSAVVRLRDAHLRGQLALAEARAAEGLRRGRDHVRHVLLRARGGQRALSRHPAVVALHLVLVVAPLGQRRRARLAGHAAREEELLLRREEGPRFRGVAGVPLPRGAAHHQLVARAHELIGRDHALLCEGRLGEHGRHVLRRAQGDVAAHLPDGKA